MGTDARALERRNFSLPRGAVAFPVGYTAMSVVAVLVAPNGSYAIVALALIWFPYLVMNPQAGLWFAPVLVMTASVVASPTGFIAGWGYSPQLAFWAVAMCIASVATGLAAMGRRGAIVSSARGAVRPPLALYAFFAVSGVGVVLGLVHGYSVLDVGKQFFGCLLFVAYFWFAIKLTPNFRDIRRVVRFVAIPALVAGLFYALIYVPVEGLVRDTILNDYGASVACLLLPQFLSRRTDVKTKAVLMSMGLMLVPLVNHLKRSVAGFAICVLLVYGLRSPSWKRRLFWLLGSFTLFGLLLATPLLNYVGRAVAKTPIISQLIPANVQKNYSVFLRVIEAEQMLAATHGPSMLGTGLGSTLRWYDPYAKQWFTQQIVDNGVVYLLIKLGFLGLAAFTWLIGGLLIQAIRNVPSGGHLALLLLVAFFTIQLVSGPAFVYFMDAPWAGIACGWLHVMNSQAKVWQMPTRVATSANISPHRSRSAWGADAAVRPGEATG